MGEEEVKDKNNSPISSKIIDSSESEEYGSSRRFSNAGDAVKELFEGFNDWSTTVSSNGMYLSYAVIAANWAVYGSAHAIIQNFWAKSSIAIVILFLGLNLFCSWLMTRCYAKRCEYADKDKGRWSIEFENEKTTSSAWPYTKFIERLGGFIRFIKVFVPIIAGIIFIIGLFCGGQADITGTG